MLLTWLLVVLLLLPVLVIILEGLSSLFSARHPLECVFPRPELTVLIPAHNEAMVIAETLASVMPQLEVGDRLMVVADNCTDDTAAIALTFGAIVVERNNIEERGKGYALAYGLNELRNCPPEVLIMVDADCIVDVGSIDVLARSASEYNQPIQSLYLMTAGKNTSLKVKVAEFAWLVKNKVRALGLFHLGLPVQLMGAGMAFPWQIIEKAELASSAIVEDMQMGIELALQGHKTCFCPNACVTSNFPATEQDTGTQRRRWEHGHITMIVTYGPRLLWEALRKRDAGLFALGLDLMVPPLALQSVLLLIGLVFIAIVFGLNEPFVMLLCGCILFVFVLALCWWRFARQVISFKELLSIPVYVFSKLLVYVSYFFSRESKWIRTGRTDD